MSKESLITQKIKSLEELVNHWEYKDDFETKCAISMLEWCIKREKRALHELQRENLNSRET